MSKQDFSLSVKQYLKAAGYSQKNLANELKINASVLAHKLNGTGRTILTHPEIKEIVKALAKLEAISERSQALDLLEKAACPAFTQTEWKLNPLDKLDSGFPLSNENSYFSKSSGKTLEPNPESKVSSNNLPNRLTTFIGREQEIEQVSHLLLNATRVLTLTGAGGVGKTRLSIEIGSRLVESFENGVWLVEFASIEDFRLTTQVIATTLNLRQPPGQPLLTTLIKYFQTKRLLLIFDNCEHIIQSVADTAESLLKACPNIYILATSREPLKVEGEIDWKVPFLSFPDRESDFNFENLAQFESVRLFIDRAKAIKHDFVVSENQKGEIAKICQDLDGLPLAIELAAARVRNLSIEEIAQRLQDRFHFLTSGKRTSLPRHQTLKALVDWSYDLLSKDEQQLLDELSIFAGNWTFEAAEAICLRGEANYIYKVFNLLTQLVEKSLIVEEIQDGQSRYSMLETIRHYGQSKLRQTGKEAQVRGNHAVYYTNILSERESGLQNGRPETLEEISRDIENIRNAWYWLVANNQLSIISQCVSGLSFLYQYKGFFREGEEALYAALTQLRSIENANTATDWNYQDTLARVLIEIGAFLRENASFEQLCIYGEEALKLALATQQPGLEGAALARLGSGLLWQGKTDKARNYLERGLQIAETAKFPLIQADCLRQLGILWDIDEDYSKSVYFSESAIKLYRNLGNRLWESASLLNLGEAYFQQGYFQTAKEFILEAFELSRKINFHQIQTLSSINSGKINTFLGNMVEANYYLEMGLDLAYRARNSRAEAEALCAFSLFSQFQGDYKTGLEQSQQALKITQEQGNREYEGYALTFFGHALNGLTKWEEARQAYLKAVDLRFNLGQRAKMLDPLGGLLEYCLTKMDLSAGENYLQRILEILENKNWSFVGIVDPLRIYEVCQAFLEQGVNNAGTTFDSRLVSQIQKFKAAAIKGYLERFQLTPEIGRGWYPKIFQAVQETH